MSEIINTSEITEVETTATEAVATTETVESSVETAQTALSSAKEKRGYQNKVAKLLNNFAFAGILLTIVSLGFQCYLSITSYVQQMAPMGIAILYTVVSILTPLFAMLAACGLFKFFAEVVELLDRNGKN